MKDRVPNVVPGEGSRVAAGRRVELPSRIFTLSPSSFAFLWEECRRCFYLQVASKFQRPRSIMPKIFTVIDGQMKTCLTGNRIDLPDLPGGVLGHPELWVESTPILLPGRTATCILRGRLDNLIAFDDRTYGVVDRKTCSTKDEHVPLYGRQLHAYAYCLEHPAPGKALIGPVSRLGLLVFEPDGFTYPVDGSAAAKAALMGPVSWIEVPRDYEAFLAFLCDVVAVLEQPQPPPGSPACEWCRYRDTSRRTGL